MKVISRTEGFQEMAKVLQALPDRMASNVITPAAREGAKVLQEAMIEKAPVGSHYEPSKAHKEYGSLRDNIKVKVLLHDRYRAIFQIGVDKFFPAHWIEFGRIGSKVKNKKVLSDGKQFFGKGVAPVRAHPFVRPALDEKAQDTVRTVIEKMLSGLTTQAQKLAADYGTARKALLTKKQRLG